MTDADQDDRPTLAECQAEDREKAILEVCREEPEFVWKEEALAWVSARLQKLYRAGERSARVSLLRDMCEELETYIDDYKEETAEGLAEENMDPYTLRGLRRSDF